MSWDLPGQYQACSNHLGLVGSSSCGTADWAEPQGCCYGGTINFNVRLQRLGAAPVDFSSRCRLSLSYGSFLRNSTEPWPSDYSVPAWQDSPWGRILRESGVFGGKGESGCCTFFAPPLPCRLEAHYWSIKLSRSTYFSQDLDYFVQRVCLWPADRYAPFASNAFYMGLRVPG